MAFILLVPPQEMRAGEKENDAKVKKLEERVQKLEAEIDRREGILTRLEERIKGMVVELADLQLQITMDKASATILESEFSEILRQKKPGSLAENLDSVTADILLKAIRLRAQMRKDFNDSTISTSARAGHYFGKKEFNPPNAQVKIFEGKNTEEFKKFCAQEVNLVFKLQTIEDGTSTSVKVYYVDANEHSLTAKDEFYPHRLEFEIVGTPRYLELSREEGVSPIEMIPIKNTRLASVVVFYTRSAP